MIEVQSLSIATQSTARFSGNDHFREEPAIDLSAIGQISEGHDIIPIIQPIFQFLASSAESPRISIHLDPFHGVTAEPVKAAASGAQVVVLPALASDY
jgi:hypothetical protein